MPASIIHFLSKHRWTSTCMLVSAALCVLLCTSGPVDGCYTFSDFTTAGHNFLHFSNGQVHVVFEHAPPQPLGTYEYVEGLGWIWTFTKTGRQVRVKAFRLWIRFEQLDSLPRPPKVPFEYRDLNFLKTRKFLQLRHSPASGRASEVVHLDLAPSAAVGYLMFTNTM